MASSVRAPRNPRAGICVTSVRACTITAAIVIGCLAVVDTARAQATAPEIVQIVLAGPRSPDGDIRMVTAVYKPPGDGKWPVLVYSHGRSGSDADRRGIKPPDPRGHIRYWLQKGFAVVAPIRPGYGDTGGVDREYSGVRYDMASVSFSKGLGAPAGSVLAGPRELMTRAARLRRRLGGAMRQVGILAAAALHGLDHHRDRLAADHANARRLAASLATCAAVQVDLASVQTNIVVFHLKAGAPDAATVVAQARQRGVLVGAFGSRTVRAVTHLDVSAQMCDEATSRLVSLLG